MDLSHTEECVASERLEISHEGDVADEATAHDKRADHLWILAIHVYVFRHVLSRSSNPSVLLQLMVPVQAARQLISNGLGQHILATGSASSAPEATSGETGCLGFGAAGSATSPKGWFKGGKGGGVKGKGAKGWGKGGKACGFEGGKGWGLEGGEGWGDGHGKGDCKPTKRERKGLLQLEWQIAVL